MTYLYTCQEYKRIVTLTDIFGVLVKETNFFLSWIYQYFLYFWEINCTHSDAKLLYLFP
jgi:hypothetical protein